jgi:hypothetical protein
VRRKRKMSRPRKIYLEDGENDLGEPKMKRWRRKANRREEWACVILEKR